MKAVISIHAHACLMRWVVLIEQGRGSGFYVFSSQRKAFRVQKYELSHIFPNQFRKITDKGHRGKNKRRIYSVFCNQIPSHAL